MKLLMKYMDAPINPFSKGTQFVNSVIDDATTFGLAVSALALIFVGIGYAFSNEHDRHKWKPWFKGFVISLFIMVAAKGIVAWLKQGLS
jgi:hypothetical protein